MTATRAADFTFVPQVASQHIQAYFDKELSFGALALIDKTLTAQPGDTVTFPYYKKIGAAEDLTEATAMSVDKLQDDKFTVSVKEMGKAVGFSKSAHRKSGAGQAMNEQEAYRQIARVMAEKVESDLITTINQAGQSTAGKLATTATEYCNINDLLMSKIIGFGDKQKDAQAIIMHSLDYANLMTNQSSGFLKADANDPFWGRAGFEGRLLGMAVFLNDNVPEVAGGVAGKKAWYHFITKANPYGIYMAEEMQLDTDKDILTRETIIAATEWYGVLSLHSKVDAADKRIIKGAFTTALNV